MGAHRNDLTAPDTGSRDGVAPVELSTTETAARLNRSAEFVRLAYRDGRLRGREEELGGNRTKIWIDGSSAQAMAAELAPSVVTSDADEGLSTADVRISLLEDALNQSNVGRVLDENTRLRDEATRLRAEITRLQLKVNRMAAALREDTNEPGGSGS